MTLNTDQAKSDAEDLYNQATQEEIAGLLVLDGPLHCHAVASKIGKTPQETRWHLVQMVDRGEVDYSWIRGYSV